MKKLFTAIFLIAVTFMFSQELASKESIMKLLELNKTTEKAESSINNMMKTLETHSQSDEEKEFFRRFAEKFSNSKDRYLDKIIALYQKHYTQKDVLGLIDFYNTPLGQKLVEKNQTLFTESYEIGEKLGEEIAKEVIMEMVGEEEVE